MAIVEDVVCYPLTPDRWDDLVTLFGPDRGAYGGCWCMYWRSDLSQARFNKLDRSERKSAFASVVSHSEIPPGLLAYNAENRPVGWVAVGPRPLYPRFNKQQASRLAPDEISDGLWSVNCFFIDRAMRRSGLMRVLIAAAIEFAKGHGARAIDAAPLDVSRKLVSGEGFVGIASAFAAEGFDVVRRTSTAKPLMRKTVSP